jgi:hypothetical protein
MIFVVTRLRSVIRNPSKVPALAGFLTLSGSVLVAGLTSSAAYASSVGYAAPGATKVCPIDDQQKLVAELTGNNRAFVAPGATVTYVEQVYNPGPETYQEVLTTTQLDPYLTPKRYPAGTQVSHVSDHYVLSGQSYVPMPPGATQSQTLTAVVGQKAVSAGAQLQAWGISETLNGAACDLAQPVIVIIHRVPRGAPHTGDGSMARQVVGRPAHPSRPAHRTRPARRVHRSRTARRVHRSRVAQRASEGRAVTRHLTFRVTEFGRTVIVTVTVAPEPGRSR